MELRDGDLRQHCLAFARLAAARGRRVSDDPELAALLRVIAARRRRQVARLCGPQPAAAPSAADAARVLSLDAVGPELRILRLSKPAGFHFEAGQHVKLRIGDVSRPYSLVSAPHEPWLEFFIEPRPGGAIAAVLARTRVGDRVGVGRARGGLVLSPRRRRHLMIATVTGIAPFVSLLRDRLRRPAADEFHVLHGASYQDEFGYDRELRALAARHVGRAFYTAAVSRPGEPRNHGWSGPTGRIADAVEGYLRQHGMTPDDTALYACGHPGLVAAVGERWGGVGFEVLAEPY